MFTNESGEEDKNKKDLLRKGVFPYDYMDERDLPPSPPFYSKLNEKGISNDDYCHAESVWNVFECHTLRDNKTDVLLLADVFENCRDVYMKNYLLDPAHY